jgi:phosphatidylserine/phosphatidylglycerophosphate/cardiolipin synthase-like enzyme
LFALRSATADPPRHDSLVLAEGETCWRIRRADRAAFLIDGAAYFLHLKAALAQARRSILIVGWDIHSRLRLTPQELRDGDGGLPDELGPLLDHLTRRRRGLHVHILIWDWLPLAGGRTAGCASCSTATTRRRPATTRRSS